MRFHPKSDQLAIQESVMGACKRAMPRDDLLAFVETGLDHHAESWKAIADLGVGAIVVPEDQRGIGLGVFEAALSMEAIGYNALPGPAVSQILIGILFERMSELGVATDIRAGLSSGELIAACAFGGDWIPVSWSAEYSNGCVNGEVAFAPSGESSDVVLVGTKGGGLALVVGRDGVIVSNHNSLDRTRPMSRLIFENAPAIEVCPPGDSLVQRVFDAALVLVAADALGGAQYCVDISVDYAKEREQFGQPVGQFQAVKHQLAEMAMGVESARALVWYAAYAWDKSLPDATRVAALTKAHLCERFVRVARDAVSVHGGIGYTWEYGLNIWFRRSICNAAFLGSPSLHRSRAADLADW